MYGLLLVNNTCTDEYSTAFVTCDLEGGEKKGTIVIKRSPTGMDGTVDQTLEKESVHVRNEKQ